MSRQIQIVSTSQVFQAKVIDNVRYFIGDSKNAEIQSLLIPDLVADILAKTPNITKSIEDEMKFELSKTGFKQDDINQIIAESKLLEEGMFESRAQKERKKELFEQEIKRRQIGLEEYVKELSDFPARINRVQTERGLEELHQEQIRKREEEIKLLSEIVRERQKEIEEQKGVNGS